MADETTNDGKKKLSLSRPGKLELNKTVEAGLVKQSFSHGRSKAVQVEVRKKRTFAPGKGGKMTEVRPGQPGADGGADAEHLTDSERQARAQALQEAMKVDEQQRKTAEEEAREAAAKRRAATEEQRRAEEEEAARREARRLEEEAKQQQAAAVAEAAPEEVPTVLPPVEDAAPRRAEKPKAADAPARGKGRTEDLATEEQRRAATRRAAADGRRRTGKLTITQAMGDGQERTRSLASVRRAREKQKQKGGMGGQAQQKQIRDVVIPEAITVQELAVRMAERGADVVKTLMKMGVMATINQSIDADTAELVVGEFGHNVKRVSDADVELGLSGADDRPEDMVSRPPVVTVMGHVDHGKTSLLDALRATDVAAGEAGGITQHIGAYQVTLPSGARISFIDTPGHAAFSAMRSRGAKVTDIVVLVVAADDGIMPQTIEAIRHAKAAGAPIIVAINKMDLPGADPNRVRQELLNHELVVEQMGGDVLNVEISAKARTNLDKLEEVILLQAEMLDLRANPNRPAEGVVIEAKMERGRGPVATALIQRGTLKVGDIVIAGNEWGRVRALIDDHGKTLEQAGPGCPVEVIGLNAVPAAGDDLTVVDGESRAREISEFRQRRERQAKAAASARGSLEQMFQQIKEGEIDTLPVVVKGDVQGSVEAIMGAVEKLSTDEVKVNVLHSAVGAINESDVTLARASNALIIGFNVRANPQARDLAKRDGVEIRYYSIIYDVTEDLRQMLSGMLAPTLREKFLGYAQIREVFNITKVGKVAGCMVTEGVVKRGAKVRLLRDDVVIHEGDLSTLQRFKDEVKEVKEGYECGMSFAKYNDIQQGDMIECFEMEQIAREL